MTLECKHCNTTSDLDTICNGCDTEGQDAISEMNNHECECNCGGGDPPIYDIVRIIVKHLEDHVLPNDSMQRINALVRIVQDEL